VTPLAPEAAFAFVADFANSALWDPGVAASERIDGGPVAVGARYRLAVRLGGRTAPMEYRISVLEAPTRVVLTGEGSGVSAVDEIAFAPAGTGTRIDYTADIHLGGAMRLIQPFLGRAFAALARNALAGMQKTLDGLAATGGNTPKATGSDTQTGDQDADASGPTVGQS
jgi:carbon monoxide dehydrogenase subunit G